MGKKSKKFIDKHDPRTQSFQLVHRSQRDPLAADAEASRMVLRALDGSDFTGPGSGMLPGAGPAALLAAATKEQRSHKAELAALGIHFGDDDEYDYAQHLRERGQPNSELILADPREVSKAARARLELPAEALPSAYEEDVGVLGRAAPVVGFRPDWDPDIVAALDDALDMEDPDNELEDDFMQLAMADGGEEDGHDWATDDDAEYEEEDEEDEEDEEEDWATDEADDVFDDQDAVRGFARARAGQQQQADTKSRFTEYSMTSSILPRSELEQTHDARFEKLFEQYDDDQIGPLDDTAEEAFGGYRDTAALAHVLDAHLAQHTNLRGSYLDGLHDPRETRRFARAQLAREASEPAQTEVVAAEPRPEKEWDCESILSTRSNLYNHPTRISEPAKIKLDKRGVPVNVLQSHAASRTAAKLAAVAEDSGKAAATAAAAAGGDDKDDDDDEEEEEEEEEDTPENKGVARARDETPEERHARKQAIKEERRARRAGKKSTKTAFKAEEKRQTEQQLRVKRNPTGVRL